MESEIPYGPGETAETHAERKIVLGSVRTAILVQQKCYKGGVECKQWFLDEIMQLPVHLQGSARELEEGISYLGDESDREVLEDELTAEWTSDSETL